LSVTRGTCGTLPAWSGAAGAANATLKEHFFMGTNNPEIVEGLLKWWNTRFGIVTGSRNANLYKLAAAFNNYGIPQVDALEVCLRYVDPSGPDPLTAGEITATVASAYRRTEHGVKEWTQGTPPRNYPPPPRRTLSDAQARAVEDRLVEVLRKQWQTVAIPPPPPLPASAPPPPPPVAPLLTDAEILLRRMAERNPAINTLVDVLGLDLSAAKITNLQTTNSPTR